jgi:hypothetical protein
MLVWVLVLLLGTDRAWGATYAAVIDPTDKTFTGAAVGYGAQPAQTFTITNTGSARLTGLRATLGGSDFQISSRLSSAAISVGGKATISVRPGTGLRAGTCTDILTITGNGGFSLTAPLSFTVTTTPTYRAVIDPTRKTFPDAAMGYGNTWSTQVFTITNTGSGRLTGVQAAIGGADFEISSRLSPSTIESGGKATVSVRPKTSLGVGTYNGTLTIAGNDDLSLTVPLSFTVNTGLSHRAVIDPTDSTFAGAVVGYDTRPARTFTITNTGSAPLTSVRATLGSSGFEISSPLSSTAIGFGGTATIGIRPRGGLGANTWTDTLTITGSNGLSLTASLSFLVTATPTYRAAIDPTGRTFDEAAEGYGEQPAQTFTITNVGSERLSNVQATLGGSSFEIASPLGSAALDPGGRAAVGVRPKTGLGANTWTDTLAVTGSNGLSLTAPLSFTVSDPVSAPDTPSVPAPDLPSVPAPQPPAAGDGEESTGGGCSVGFSPFALSALIGMIAVWRKRI